ncbi:MAG: hypothetical protein VB142_03220 [Burkholderia sp.]
MIVSILERASGGTNFFNVFEQTPVDNLPFHGPIETLGVIPQNGSLEI